MSDLPVLNRKCFTGKRYSHYSDSPAVQHFIMAIEDIALTNPGTADGSPVIAVRQDIRTIKADFIWMLSPGMGGRHWFGEAGERSEAVRALRRYHGDLGDATLNLGFYRHPLSEVINLLDDEELQQKKQPVNVLDMAVSFMQAINPAIAAAEWSRENARQRNAEREAFREKVWEHYYGL